MPWLTGYIAGVIIATERIGLPPAKKDDEIKRGLGGLGSKETGGETREKRMGRLELCPGLPCVIQ